MSVNARFGYSDADIRMAECSVSEAVTDLVCIAGDPPNGYDMVTKADPSNYDKLPAVGVIIEKTAADRCLVMWRGETPEIFTGLESGEIYFLGTDAKLADVPPVPITVPLFAQPVAVATAPTRAYIKPDNSLTKRVP